MRKDNWSSSSLGQKMSQATARRIALGAQGFGQPRLSRPPTVDQITDLIDLLGLLQLDTVNVFCRSHYMPVYSRLGPYDRALLDRIAAHTHDGIGRRLVEYLAHEASLIPFALHPLFRWRMARVEQDAWTPLVNLAQSKPHVIEAALQQVSERGPIRASATGGSRTKQNAGALWSFQEDKAALKYLFHGGLVTAAARINFERLYDIPERVLPADILDQSGPYGAVRADPHRRVRATGNLIESRSRSRKVATNERRQRPHELANQHRDNGKWIVRGEPRETT